MADTIDTETPEDRVNRVSDAVCKILDDNQHDYTDTTMYSAFYDTKTPMIHFELPIVAEDVEDNSDDNNDDDSNDNNDDSSKESSEDDESPGTIDYDIEVGLKSYIIHSDVAGGTSVEYFLDEEQFLSDLRMLSEEAAEARGAAPTPATRAIKRERGTEDDDLVGLPKKRQRPQEPGFVFNSPPTITRFQELYDVGINDRIQKEKDAFGHKVTIAIFDAAKNGQEAVEILEKIYGPSSPPEVPPHFAMEHRMCVLDALVPIGWTVSKPTRIGMYAKWTLTPTSSGANSSTA